MFPIEDLAFLSHCWYCDTCFYSTWQPSFAPFPACVLMDLCVGSIEIKAQYSNVGGTSAEYAATFVSVLMIRRFLRRNPNVQLAFFTIWSMWSFHRRLFDMSTPRYFAALGHFFQSMHIHRSMCTPPPICQNAPISWPKPLDKTPNNSQIFN